MMSNKLNHKRDWIDKIMIPNSRTMCINWPALLQPDKTKTSNNDKLTSTGSV